MAEKKKIRRQQKEPKVTNNKVTDIEILMIRDRVIDLYYRQGYLIDEIADKLNIFKHIIKRIIDKEEESKRIPAILKKVEPRKPNMYMVYDKEHDHVWYDITEYILDTPGKFSDPSEGRVKVR